MGLIGDFLEAFVRPRSGLLIFETHLRPTEDGAENVIEIVGDAAGEPADRLEFLQLQNLMFQAFAHAALGGFANFPLDGREKTLEVAFHQVVLRALAESGHGSGFVHAAGDKDEGEIGLAFADDAQGVEPGESGHVVIGNHQIPFTALQRGTQSGGTRDALGVQTETTLA